MRHGAKVKLCSYEGCTNYPQKGGVCVKHGAKVYPKRCSRDGCANRVVKGGVCVRHGAHRNANDESTAFGSELEQTTADQFQPNESAAGSSILGQGVAQGVPGEVAILCQEIVEI